MAGLPWPGSERRGRAMVISRTPASSRGSHPSPGFDGPMEELRMSLGGFGPRTVRRIGYALVVYGLLGIAVVVTLLGGSVVVANRLERADATLQGQRDRLVRTLTSTTAVLEAVADALDEGRGGIESSARLASRSAGLAR